MTEAARDQIAPPQYLPCPRCGAATFTRQDVKKHDAEHAKQDQRDERLEKLLERLEGFLDAADSIEDDNGDSMTFAEWIAYVEQSITDLTETRTAPAAALTLQPGVWPTDTDDDEEPAVPVRTIFGTDIPDVSDLVDDEDDDDATVPQPWGARP